MNSLFSPDGKQTVFTWFRGEIASLKLTTLAGDSTRTVGGEGENYGTVASWLPDGTRVVIVANENWRKGDRRILIVDLAGGSKREVTRVPAEVSASMNINALASPDGNYILFDRRKSATAGDRDIYVVPVAGGEARPLIADPSNDWLIAWTPAGSRLVFSSNRGAGWGLYLVAFRDGKLEGEPALLKEGLRGFPIGFDRKGNYYYDAIIGGSQTLRVAPFDPVAGKATGPAKIVPVRRGMGMSGNPVWTPDGRMLAFQRRSGTEDGTEFVITDPETGTEAKVIQTTLNFPPGIRFRPDGSAVVREPGSGPVNEFNVNWEKGILEPFQLAESSDKGHACAGPSVRTQATKNGLFVFDYASNRSWLLSDRTDLARGDYSQAVSPDCKLFAYTPNPARSIRLIDLATGSERELVSVEDPRRLLYLTFTPDGQRLLFTRIKNEREASELWSVPVSGGTAAPTGVAIHGLRNPVVSPDGRRLAFTGGQGNYEAYVAEGLLPPSLRKP
ncbi:MAG: hypothetical protein AAB225_00545, partial [Acidobacteriota bacterium]